MISTVVVTLNEGKVLKDCLASVNKNCDEVIILDLGSTDDTLTISKKYNAKIFTHQKVDYVEKVRDLATSKAKGDWILVLDPDERMSINLWSKLKEIVLQNQYMAVNIPRKNIFFNKWVAHSNWWPDRQVRFFKKGRVKWGNIIHLYPKVDGKIKELEAKEDLAIMHLGYRSVNEFIDRQNRYSTIEARILFERGERFSWGKFFWKPQREFLVRLIKHLGFLDGFLGFSLTYLMMIYQLEVMIKLWELEQEK